MPGLNMEIGSIILYPGSTVPSGYLLCDGSAISRETYAALFSVIGTIYGAGDDNTTFNLPSMDGRVPVGVSPSYALGSSGGAESVTLDSTKVPNHYHVIPQHTHQHTIAAKTPSLSHTITQPVVKYTKIGGTGNNAGSGSTTANKYNSSNTGTMSRSANLVIADHAATACTMSGSITDCAALTSGATGGGGAHNNMMPFIALNYIIYAGA